MTGFSRYLGLKLHQWAERNPKIAPVDVIHLCLIPTAFVNVSILLYLSQEIYAKSSSAGHVWVLSGYQMKRGILEPQ